MTSPLSPSTAPFAHSLIYAPTKSEQTTKTSGEIFIFGSMQLLSMKVRGPIFLLLSARFSLFLSFTILECVVVQ